jgi:hypothetical protein
VCACVTVLHFNSSVTLVGGNRLNALSVGGRCRSAFMDLYSRTLEYPLFFSLSKEMWGHWRQKDNDRLLTNSCLFTIHDYVPIRFAACKMANFISTFHRIRDFWDVIPCRLIDGYLMVCCGNLPPHTHTHTHNIMPTIQGRNPFGSRKNIRVCTQCNYNPEIYFFSHFKITALPTLCYIYVYTWL